MNRSERFYRIEQLLCSPDRVTPQILAEKLEVSRATVTRDLSYMRDRMRVPIVWDRIRGSYRLDQKEGRSSLPGLWFNSSEALALLSMENLLSNLSPGLLTAHIEPLRERILGLMNLGEHSYTEVLQRLRVLPHSSRTVSSEHFQQVFQAVLERHRLCLLHHNRVSGEFWSVKFPRSAWCTIAIAGIWMPGVICAVHCAVSGWMRCGT